MSVVLVGFQTTPSGVSSLLKDQVTDPTPAREDPFFIRRCKNIYLN